MKLTSYLRALRRSRACCGQCFWVTGVLSTGRKLRIFRRRAFFHVLVVAGLHVGALAFALYWVGRKLRLPRTWTAVLTITLLFSYVAVVEQRPPVLRGR